MSSAGSLLKLGERYAALGLSTAARSALERAARDDTDDPRPLRLLTELTLATGDVHGARTFAAALKKIEKTPYARLLVGLSQLAAGEYAGARFAFAAIIDQPKARPEVRLRALVGRAKVADAESDAAGAAANVMVAIELLLSMAVSDTGHEDIDAQLELAEEVLGWSVYWDRGADAGTLIDEAAEKRPGPPFHLLRGLWLAARQRHGDSAVRDDDIEAELVAEITVRPTSVATRLRLCQSLLRRRYRDDTARQEALTILDALAGELSGQESPSLSQTRDLARVHFLRASALEDNPDTVEAAEAAYRSGLALRPGNLTAMNKLAIAALSRGDQSVALEEIERALRIDPDHAYTWRTAARLLESSGDRESMARRILEAARPGAGSFAGELAPKLIAATGDIARGDVLAGVHARGHRLKNLLSIVGSRARSARKLAGEGEVGNRLQDLEGSLTALYDEWATYLRSMHSTPVVEVLPVGALVHEVVEAARDTGGAQIDLDMKGVLPNLRGDRMLLREALVNILVNAVEASGEGRVFVTVRTEVSAGAPRIKIAVVDSGPGIPLAQQGQVFSPGFTTKESGSGVGLAIAERVVSAHHGRIVLESESGQGATFTVILPSDLGGFATLGALSSEGGDG
jgi:signal transduction histidine kinase